MRKVEDRGLAALARTGEAEEIIGADGSPNEPVQGPSVLPTPTSAATPPSTTTSVLRAAYGMLGAVSAAASGFHGYRRNRNSLGWGVAWFALGGMFPVITPTIAVAQGFGKVKPLTNSEKEALTSGR